MSDDRAIATRLLSLAQILWTVLITLATIALGAYIGWQGHGIVGALALGFLGLVAGWFLSSPTLLLQLLQLLP
ncbi:small-conductance mechanosensitive channel [Ensifer sp. KUDG1]|uniref:hypothetical protein n=1 Tax=Ensifer sp. KUDG1 TaxID=3373919 RepID=UPI003D20CDB0